MVPGRLGGSLVCRRGQAAARPPDGGPAGRARRTRGLIVNESPQLPHVVDRRRRGRGRTSGSATSRSSRRSRSGWRPARRSSARAGSTARRRDRWALPTVVERREAACPRRTDLDPRLADEVDEPGKHHEQRDDRSDDADQQEDRHQVDEPAPVGDDELSRVSSRSAVHHCSSWSRITRACYRGAPRACGAYARVALVARDLAGGCRVFAVAPRPGFQPGRFAASSSLPGGGLGRPARRRALAGERCRPRRPRAGERRSSRAMSHSSGTARPPFAVTRSRSGRSLVITRTRSAAAAPPWPLHRGLGDEVEDRVVARALARSSARACSGRCRPYRPVAGAVEHEVDRRSGPGSRRASGR